jgi:hypothetical protein
MSGVEQDWRALREYLIKTLADAKLFAARSPMLPGGFEGQVEVLSSALDFMDERERARHSARVSAASQAPVPDPVEQAANPRLTEVIYKSERCS